MDMGVRSGVIAGNLIGILAQRLVRKLRPACREAYAPSPLERRLLGVVDDRPLTLYRVAEEYRHAEHQGYEGRTAVMEVLRFDDELDEAVTRGASTRELLRLATARGFRPLAESAIRRVLDGTTTLDEVTRVVDLTDRLQ
jgi:type II secretory ATPase GspE/PulE/Tfp pilus assembly ATPase PilB-like protein